MKTDDKYNETLRKLFLKGIINEEQLREKMKNTEFENNVKRATLETMDNGYVKDAMIRIYKEKRK